MTGWNGLNGVVAVAFPALIWSSVLKTPAGSEKSQNREKAAKSANERGLGFN